MRLLLKMMILISFLFLNTFSQDNYYWKNAPIEGSKIYTIKFLDNQSGIAISESGKILLTSDNGENWYLDPETQNFEDTENYLWGAEIYCSVMNTNDGGTTWHPYAQKQQEHFCNVYFNDKNTGWKVAEEFLSKVANVINKYVQNDNVKLLIDKPNKCTEYYTDINTGWALGWCIRNFEIH